MDRIYERQKNYAEAEIWLRKLAASDPNDPVPRLYLGQALSAEGKYDQAVEQLKEELQIHPQNGAAALELAKVYAKAGEDAEAEQQFRIVVAAQPQNAEAHYAFGSLLMQEKNYPEAQQELTTTINLKRELIDAYGDLAAAAASNKNYSLALQVLDDRATTQADPPAICFLRAATYDNLKDVPKAVEYYQKFLAEDGGKFPRPGAAGAASTHRHRSQERRELSSKGCKEVVCEPSPDARRRPARGRRSGNAIEGQGRRCSRRRSS